MNRLPTLISLDEALQLDRVQNRLYHERHLNPRFAKLISVLGADKEFAHASGLYVWDSEGTQYLDFLAGFGTLSLGHNHPCLLRALDRTRELATLIEEISPLEGALAYNLAALTEGQLERVFFASSGAETVDNAIKLARAATDRTGFVACHGGFHGRTVGALSVTQRREYREPFGRLLPEVAFVPFGDSRALERALRRRRVAGFIMEPIQAEGGVVVPPPGYLQATRELCTRYGALFIADEIQTGLGRTGRTFAVDHEAVMPDVLLLGKALGGGLLPISALLTTDRLFREAGGGTARTPFHSSTFGGNGRACAAALATLEVMQREDLTTRAEQMGAYLVEKLRALQERQPLIAGVRGRGLLVGIEWAPATRGLRTVFTGGLVNRLSRDFFSGLVMIQLLQRHHIMTAFPLNDPNVLRLEPPLTVERKHIDYVVSCLEKTLQECQSFVAAGLRMQRGILRAVLA
jgi:putrescine aminotransferase